MEITAIEFREKVMEKLTEIDDVQLSMNNLQIALTPSQLGQLAGQRRILLNLLDGNI